MLSARLMRLALVTTLLGAGVVVTAAAAPAQAGGSHVIIQGSGSTWSSNAVNQWIGDVNQYGIQVVFTANGSSQGRKDFASGQTDFGVSEIPYGQDTDPGNGSRDSSNGRPYAYVPIVAGGTSFTYQVKVAGQLVKNLRLSGQTIARIFTNQITNWNDPAITADNNGRGLPSLPIIPVVRSDGSGTTAQFTRYLDTEFPNDWRAYNGGRGGLTSYYPRQGPAMVAQNGSDGVMNYVSAAAANGAIGYVEYSYPLQKNFPVVKLLNKSGYFVQPTQYNVAVALQKAQINTDKGSSLYLTQILDQVYENSDPRAYPMSSYSYMIIPTGTDQQDSKENTNKRQTLADFMFYSLCEGQRAAGPLGYSPLPVNLVRAGFDQINALGKADANVDISNRDVTKCNNPTFDVSAPDRNYLAEVAPQPADCDKSGAGPCGSTNPAAANANPGTVAGGPAAKGGGATGGTATKGGGVVAGGARRAAPGGTTAPTGGNSSGPGAPAGAGPGTAAGAPTGTAAGAPGALGTAAMTADPAAGAMGAAATDPELGGRPAGAGAAAGGGTALTTGDSSAPGGDPALPVSTELASSRSAGASSAVLGPLALLLLIAAIAAPPLLRSRLTRRGPGAARGAHP